MAERRFPYSSPSRASFPTHALIPASAGSANRASHPGCRSTGLRRKGEEQTEVLVKVQLDAGHGICDVDVEGLLVVVGSPGIQHILGARHLHPSPCLQPASPFPTPRHLFVETVEVVEYRAHRPRVQIRRYYVGLVKRGFACIATMLAWAWS